MQIQHRSFVCTQLNDFKFNKWLNIFICSVDGTLTDSTTPGQSWPRVMALNVWWCCVLSRTLVDGILPLCRDTIDTFFSTPNRLSLCRMSCISRICFSRLYTIKFDSPSSRSSVDSTEHNSFFPCFTFVVQELTCWLIKFVSVLKLIRIKEWNHLWSNPKSV